MDTASNKANMDFLSFRFSSLFLVFPDNCMHKKWQLHILQLPPSHNTWFICTRYICNFRFCLIHLIKELCIVMRIQVLYTADLKFYAKAVLLTSIIAVSPFPVFPVVSEKSAPIHSDGIAPDSHRILFCASSTMQPLRYNIAHIQFGYSFFITFYQNVNTIRVYFPLMFGISVTVHSVHSNVAKIHSRLPAAMEILACMYIIALFITLLSGL